VFLPLARRPCSMFFWYTHVNDYQEMPNRRAVVASGRGFEYEHDCGRERRSSDPFGSQSAGSSSPEAYGSNGAYTFLSTMFRRNDNGSYIEFQIQIELHSSLL
jgi:hypothetical protein